ncbi:hypothetical protein [Cryptosporidium hominis TU502]|nr:hypothetical protein [Cryptosporidium hominis TU502]
MYLVDISNGETTSLPIGENIIKNLLFSTFNSKMSIIICLLKNSKIAIYDIINQNIKYEEINIENLCENEQILMDQISGNIVITAKNKLIKLYYNNQVSNQVDTDSKISLISTNSKL